MKIEGIAISTMITYFCNFFFTLLYVQFQILFLKDENLKKSWFFPDRNTFKDLGEYIKLAINCCLLLVMEWWSFEIMSLLSSYLGILQNSAHLLTFSYAVLFFMFALGFQIASQTLIGNSLGAGIPQKGKKYLKIISIMATVVIVAYSSLAYSYRRALAAALTNN